MGGPNPAPAAWSVGQGFWVSANRAAAVLRRLETWQVPVRWNWLLGCCGRPDEQWLKAISVAKDPALAFQVLLKSR